MKKDAYLILHDIRSAENVGSMFRTADAIGISKIFLSGYTPAPYDRFKRKNKKIEKTALGAETTVPWERAEDVFSLLEKLKKEKVKIIALEQHADSVDYKKVKINSDTAFIVGNEVEGVPHNLLKTCDQIVEIAMKGGKESLNVSVATGILLFRLLDV